MIGRAVATAAVAFAAIAAPVSAQSLGDLARKEESRRATSSSVKSFSNADLKPSEIITPAAPGEPAPAASDCYMSKSLGKCVTADEMIANTSNNIATKEQAKQEPTWRQDAEHIRSQLARAQEELQLMTTAANDAVRSAGERAVAAKLAAQKQRIVEDLERQWDKFEKSAANDRVPRAWIEPIPTLTTRHQQ